MEWMLTRIFDGGRVMPRHVSNGAQVRGTIMVRQESDSLRHRTTLVARFDLVGAGFRTMPPLYDAQLVSSTGAVWTLTGHERVLGGPLSAEHHLVQSWILQPAATEDLIKAEREWARLAGLLHELQAKGDGQKAA